MKKITLSKKNAHDLCLVMGTIVVEKSEKMDFKEVLHIQKTVNNILDLEKDFADEVKKIGKESKQYIDNANAKISAFREKLHSGIEKEGKIDEVTEKRIQNYVQAMLQEAQTEIEAEIVPQNKALHEGIGNDEFTFEIEDDKHKIFITNFEKYAKEKYNDKKAMVETYEKLTV